MLDNQKALFDIPRGIVYLNSAAQSPGLRASQVAGERGLLRKFHPWSPERANLQPEMEHCRASIANLIGGGASADDVAICMSTSYGVAVAAANSRIEPGQEVVILDGQFPSNYFSWVELAERDGGCLRVVARPADYDWTSAVLAAIGEKTGLVALPNCHWTDGSLLDLEAIGRRCREIGAPLIIDATQSLGARPFDNGTVGADFVIASGYKWLLCPDAMGFMYTAPHRQDGHPIENNYASRVGGPSMEVSTEYGTELRPGARRFDMGIADCMVYVPMAAAALDQIEKWGPAEIEAYLRPLTDRIAELAQARGMGVPPAGRRVAHFIGIDPKRPVPDGFVAALAKRGVHVSLRGGMIRVAPYLFNDLADIDVLFEVLDEVLR